VGPSDGAADRISAGIDRGELVDRAALQALMWEHVGLERNAIGLGAASARLAAWRAPGARDRRTAEDRNLLELARLTVAAALARTGSVGAHFRSDDPAVARTVDGIADSTAVGTAAGTAAGAVAGAPTTHRPADDAVREAA